MDSHLNRRKEMERRRRRTTTTRDNVKYRTRRRKQHRPGYDGNLTITIKNIEGIFGRKTNCLPTVTT
ncbi:hypothetical protein ABKN59_009283 [Abortiporus biennis]